MTLYRKLIALTVVAATLAFQSAAGAAETKQQKIERLLELTGEAQLYLRGVEATMPSILERERRSQPTVPHHVFDRFQAIFIEEIKRAEPELRQTLARIYESTYSEEEIDGLLGFYGSDLGRKVIRSMPEFVEKMGPAVQRFGETVGVRTLRRLLPPPASREKPL